MQQGLVDAVEAILKDQIALANEINKVAGDQYPSIVKARDLSPESAEHLLGLTTKLEVLEAERNAMLEANGVTIAVLASVSPTCKALGEELRNAIVLMRESIGKNIAILDVQVLRTRSMFEAARHARGGGVDPVEYGPNGRAKRGSSGSLLGAG